MLFPGKRESTTTYIIRREKMREKGTTLQPFPSISSYLYSIKAIPFYAHLTMQSIQTKDGHTLHIDKLITFQDGSKINKYISKRLSAANSPIVIKIKAAFKKLISANILIYEKLQKSRYHCKFGLLVKTFKINMLQFFYDRFRA